MSCSDKVLRCNVLGLQVVYMHVRGYACECASACVYVCMYALMYVLIDFNRIAPSAGIAAEYDNETDLRQPNRLGIEVRPRSLR